MAKDLITLDEYKSYNGIVKTDQDFKISLLIGMVSNLIKAYIGVSLVDNYEDPITEVITLDYDTWYIYPSQFPIRDIVSITQPNYLEYDSTVHFPLDFSTDYLLDGDRIIKLGTQPWYNGPGGIVVTYRAGYESIPSDLKLAAILLVEYYVKENYIQNRSIMGTTINNYATPPGDLPEHIARILDMYKSYV